MTRKFLHVGCGPARQAHVSRGLQDPAQWTEVRFDIDRSVHPDIVGTMTDMRLVESGSMDAVYSSHNIEHLEQHEVPVALAEFRRVLGPEGFVVVTCPDLQEVCRLVHEDKLEDVAYVSPAGPITPHDILFGLGAALRAGNKYMAHRCGFTSRTLGRALHAAGFPSLAVMRRPAQLELWAVATVSKVERPQLEQLVHAHLPRH